MKSKLFILVSIGLTLRAQAITGLWKVDPVDNNWANGANWTSGSTPSDAIFGVSQITALVNQGSAASITFNAGASAYTIGAAVSNPLITGLGIINNSSVSQNFSSAPFSAYFFENNAAITGEVFMTLNSNGGAYFLNTASAGSGNLLCHSGSFVTFGDDAIAGNSMITLEGGGSGSSAGFYENAGGGSATIIAEGSDNLSELGGLVVFNDQSSAQNATLIAEGTLGKIGGEISFNASSSGDGASVKVVGSGILNIQTVTGSSLTIGSLEGDGLVLLGSKGLVEGSNNANTTFRGVIDESGSVTKVGVGALVLAGVNTYTGGTIVQEGRLLANNTTGSATGTGLVQINRGSFGGNGIVTGGVTVGDGSSSGSTLAPGINGTGLLTIQSGLTFKADSRYNWNVDARAVEADEVAAQGVTIGAGVSFVVIGRGSTPLPVGTVFTAISNTSSAPISGTFSNLADGSIFTIGSNTFQANYEGGDGNDLTLTVV
jgi:autotransporter-associated beta strand protein